MHKLLHRLILALDGFKPSRGASIAALGISLGLALASGTNLTNSLADWWCPLAKFLAGPIVWGVIFLAFLVGVAMLAAGGRGAIRLTIVAFISAIVLLVGKSWLQTQITSNAGTLSNDIKTCLGLQ